MTTVDHPWAKRGRHGCPPRWATQLLLGAALTAVTGTAVTGLASPAWAAAGARPGAGVSSAKAKIIADWDAFFSGKTPASRKVKLVQDGQEFAKVINAQAGSIMARSVAAKVSKVTLDKARAQAAVIYTITLGGAPALSNQKGTAILQAGVWKVGAQSFCSLLALEGSAKQVPVCKAK